MKASLHIKLNFSHSHCHINHRKGTSEIRTHQGMLLSTMAWEPSPNSTWGRDRKHTCHCESGMNLASLFHSLPLDPKLLARTVSKCRSGQNLGTVIRR